jgi:hypothetical protein
VPTGCNFPEHHGGGKGAGGSLLIAAVVVVVIGGLASTNTAARLASDVLDIMAWTAGGLVAVTVATITAVVMVRRRRRVRVHPLPAYVPPVRLVRSRRIRPIEAPPRIVPGTVLRDPAELRDRRSR